MNTLASSLIQRAEAADGWDELTAAEQLALRAILRRVGLMAIRGSTTAEDWSQLAGFAEWPVGKGPAAAALPSKLAGATVSGQWRMWEGKGRHPTGEALIKVRLRANNAEMTGRAGTFIWEHDGTGRDIVAYRHED